MGEPGDLAQAGLDLDHGVARHPGRTGLLEAQLQAGQRRAQLVRGVGDEVLLAANQAREPVGHLVERVGERALLGRPLDRRADVEVAAGDLAGRRLEPAHRPRELPGDDRAGPEPDEQDDHAESGEADDGAAHRAAHRRDVLADHDRARGRAAHEDRRRRLDHLAPVAPADAVVAPAAQRGRDLGVARLVEPGAARPCAVGDHVAGRVDDHHAPARGARRGRDQVPQRRALVAAE